MRKPRWLPWMFGVVVSAVPVLAFAAGSGSLDQVQSLLKGKILPWQSVMQTAATDLFYALAAVEFSVLFLNHVLQKRGHEDLFAGIIKKVVTLGFFLTLLDNSGTWVPDIINGLAGGVHALGVTAVTPGRIATEALQAFLAIVLSPMAAATHNVSNTVNDLFNFNFSAAFSSAAKTVANSNPASLLVETLLAGIIGLLAGLGILVMALEFLMVQIESYLVIALGVVMLAGGGLRWTAKYVGSFIDYAINVGVRLFILTALAYLVTYSIVPLIQTILENVTNPLQAGFSVLILGAVIALLPRKASSIANSLLSGNSTFTGGELVKEGAVAAGGTVALGAGGVALGAGALGALGGMGAGSLSAAAGAGGGAGGAGSLAGAVGAGEAGVAAGVPAPEVGALSSAGEAGMGMGPDRAVPAPKPAGGPAQGDAPQAGKVVQAPAPQAQPKGGHPHEVEAPSVSSNDTDPSGKGEAETGTGNAQPDTQSAPVNAVPAPNPASASASGGRGGGIQAPAPSTSSGGASGGAPGRAGVPAGAANAPASGPSDGASSGAASGGVGRTSGGGAESPAEGAPAPASKPSPQADAPVSAPTAPAPDAPASGGATMDDVVEQLKKMQGQPKSVVEKLTEGASGRLSDHVKKIATEQSAPVQKNAIDTSHSRDFD
ncbi:P-type conjugative transfer protein TrbL [Acidithiobacillus sp.]|uniref:P-type conjugative transfer protein TrbL n=1 Tax=Acidithiobacillus sp. TaxID=1872118 RepID=UPI003D01486C